MFDVIALGELLVDFTGSGASPQGNPVYEANPDLVQGQLLLPEHHVRPGVAVEGEVPVPIAEGRWWTLPEAAQARRGTRYTRPIRGARRAMCWPC